MPVLYHKKDLSVKCMLKAHNYTIEKTKITTCPNHSIRTITLSHCVVNTSLKPHFLKLYIA